VTVTVLEPSSTLVEFEPSSPELVLLDPSKPESRPESLLAEPSKPESVLFELEPSKPEAVLFELEPSKPEAVLFELEPSKPESRPEVEFPRSTVVELSNPEASEELPDKSILPALARALPPDL